MKNWITNTLFITICLLGLSASPSNTYKIKEDKCIKDKIYNDTETLLKIEKECYIDFSAKEEKKRLKTSNSKIVGFNKQEHVCLKLNKKFRIALESCTFNGIPLITSGLSFHKAHSKNSKHKVGKAIDIAWNKEGKEFLIWLDSEEGKLWLESFNLDFQLEKIYELKDHPKFFHNKQATGAHIHLQLE